MTQRRRLSNRQAALKHNFVTFTTRVLKTQKFLLKKCEILCVPLCLVEFVHNHIKGHHMLVTYTYNHTYIQDTCQYTHEHNTQTHTLSVNAYTHNTHISLTHFPSRSPRSKSQHIRPISLFRSRNVRTLALISYSPTHRSSVVPLVSSFARQSPSIR